MFVLLITPSASAYSTAWCGSCHQFVIVNEGVFAYNGSGFEDLTWELRASDIKREDFMAFIQTVGVANAGNLTLLYFFPYDMLYMAVYNGTLPVVMKPVLNWYVGGVWDFVEYNGSVFFVASTGISPHSSSDEVYRLDLKTFRVTAGWDLSWDARNMIAPDKAGISPYAWVNLGLDDRGRLWARVDMMMPNTTVYYLYNGTNFTPVNASPRLHIPKPEPPFRIEIKTGIGYLLSQVPSLYVPTKYILVRDGRKKDLTAELLSFAEGIRPLNVLYGFWDSEKKEWVVSFGLYGLPVTYAVNGSCRRPLHLQNMPLESYKGSYVLLGNGTLSWRNYTVRTPGWNESGSDDSETDFELEVYMKDGHPIIAFPWEYYKNGTTEDGFIACEVTDRGFVVFNTTDEKELGRNLIPPWTVPVGKWGLKWNNVTGTLKVNDTSKTALLITDNGTVPVNFTVADTTKSVVVGNGTFLLIGWDGAYIVPPYDKPVDVLSLPLCMENTTKAVQTSWEEYMWWALILVALLAAMGVFFRRR